MGLRTDMSTQHQGMTRRRFIERGLGYLFSTAVLVGGSKMLVDIFSTESTNPTTAQYESVQSRQGTNSSECYVTLPNGIVYECTAKPRMIMYPTAKRLVYPEALEGPDIPEDKRVFSWWSRLEYDRSLHALETGEYVLGVSASNIERFLPNLEGKVVADVGAGDGNNLEYWIPKLGPRGVLIETDVDRAKENFSALSAYLASERQDNSLYKSRVVIIEGRHLNTCLPKGAVDVVLMSQVHQNICRTPYNENRRVDLNIPINLFEEAESFMKFFIEGRREFLGSIYQSLRDENSRFIIIEGLKDTEISRGKIELGEEETIRGILENGFKLVGRYRDQNNYYASFSKN